MLLKSDLETPTETIAHFTRNAPVDVYDLAKALGLSVRDANLPSNVSGKIERDWRGGSFLITVNAAHGQRRRRFTVAHEIAHFVLHRDLIGDGIVDDPLYRSDRGDDVERAANAYAATILMPAPLVTSEFRSGNRSFAGIANTFEVSTEVARIRLKELRLG